MFFSGSLIFVSDLPPLFIRFGPPPITSDYRVVRLLPVNFYHVCFKNSTLIQVAFWLALLLRIGYVASDWLYCYWLLLFASDWSFSVRVTVITGPLDPQRTLSIVSNIRLAFALTMLRLSMKQQRSSFDGVCRCPGLSLKFDLLESNATS
jgi:hypothetical protein